MMNCLHLDFGWDNIPESHKMMVDEFEINDLPGLK